MNLAALIAAVYTETNRPDLVDETLQSVLEATLSAHTMEQFPKDIHEAMVVFDQPTQYLQTLDTSVIPRYRTTAYVRKLNPVATQVEQTGGLLPFSYQFPPNQFNFLTRVDIGDVIDSYGYEKRDVWYQAGRQINIKSSTPLQYAMVGWYRFPNLDPTGVNFESWVAEELPYVIVYAAAGSIFAKIGEKDSFATYMREPIPGHGDTTGGLYFKQKAILIQNNIRM